VVSLVDVAPTVADLAGIATPATDGESLRPLLEGRADRWRDAAFMEWAGGNGVPAWKAVRTRDFLYVEYATGERELYELSADPFELRSVAGKPGFASVVERLSLLLERLGGR
jgi:arylsulfatase A-like enzyme